MNVWDGVGKVPRTYAIAVSGRRMMPAPQFVHEQAPDLVTVPAAPRLPRQERFDFTRLDPRAQPPRALEKELARERSQASPQPGIDGRREAGLRPVQDLRRKEARGRLPEQDLP